MTKPLSQQAEQMITAWRQVQQLALACEATGFEPHMIGTISPIINDDYALVEVPREALPAIRQVAGHLHSYYKSGLGSHKIAVWYRCRNLPQIRLVYEKPYDNTGPCKIVSMPMKIAERPAEPAR